MSPTAAIYLDNSATTQISPAVITRMTEVSENFWANPSSVHGLGFSAEKLLCQSRDEILKGLGAKKGSGELVFTASGSEADNLALFGSAYAKSRSAGARIITTDSEHPAILRSCEELSKRGFEIVFLKTAAGLIDLDELRSAVTKNTLLISIMAVNNETGAAYNLKECFAEAKRQNPDIITHTDGVQGFMKSETPLCGCGADLITVSSHKIHGPKGMGALYIANPMIKAKKIVPIIFGGGQEKGFRSGTENLPGIAGFATAVSECSANLSDSIARMNDCREHLQERLQSDSALKSVRINTPAGNFAPHIISLTVPGIRSEIMLRYLSGREIYVSSGSACSSHSKGPSATLLSFGLDRNSADSTIRVSLSRNNTKEDIDALCDALGEGIKMLAHTLK